MKKTKEFDCVDMMHAAQEAIMKRLEGKTHEEIMEYYRQQDAETKAEIEQLRAAAAARAGKN